MPAPPKDSEPIPEAFKKMVRTAVVQASEAYGGHASLSEALEPYLGRLLHPTVIGRWAGGSALPRIDGLIALIGLVTNRDLADLATAFDDLLKPIRMQPRPPRGEAARRIQERIAARARLQRLGTARDVARLEKKVPIARVRGPRSSK